MEWKTPRERPTDTPVAATATAVPLFQSVRHTPVVLAFDIETTGPVIGQHEIVSIGACVVRWNKHGTLETLNTFKRDIRLAGIDHAFSQTDPTDASQPTDTVTTAVDPVCSLGSLDLHIASLTPQQFRDKLTAWSGFATLFDAATFKGFWSREPQLRQLQGSIIDGVTLGHAIAAFDTWLTQVASETAAQHPFLVTDNAIFDPPWLNQALLRHGYESISSHFHPSRRRVIDVRSFYTGSDYARVESLRAKVGVEQVFPDNFHNHEPLSDSLRIAFTFLTYLDTLRQSNPVDPWLYTGYQYQYPPGHPSHTNQTPHGHQQPFYYPHQPFHPHHPHHAFYSHHSHRSMYNPLQSANTPRNHPTHRSRASAKQKKQSKLAAALSTAKQTPLSADAAPFVFSPLDTTPTTSVHPIAPTQLEQPTQPTATEEPAPVTGNQKTVHPLPPAPMPPRPSVYIPPGRYSTPVYLPDSGFGSTLFESAMDPVGPALLSIFPIAAAPTATDTIRSQLETTEWQRLIRDVCARDGADAEFKGLVETATKCLAAIDVDAGSEPTARVTDDGKPVLVAKQDGPLFTREPVNGVPVTTSSLFTADLYKTNEYVPVAVLDDGDSDIDNAAITAMSSRRVKLFSDDT